MRYTALALAALLILAGACVDEEQLPFSPDGVPVADIDDGAHEGNVHFYFLPPMVDQPNYGGTFDGSLEPEVLICKWNISNEECGPAIDMYTVRTGLGSETVRIVLEDEHYIVNWHTDDVLSNFPLAEGEVYRIRVLVGVGELGHADVAVVSSGKELKNVDTDEHIPLIDGRTLPIKFRIEEGALDQAAPAVAAGGSHSCGLTADGDAYCWGYNALGAVGTGYRSSSEPVPKPVIGGHTFQSVSAGGWHTCGITTDGDAYCWGYNWWGQLGQFLYWHWHTPELVSGGHTFQALSAGNMHTCGITTDGDAYCWGSNSYGKLGTGSTSGRNPSPLLVVGGHTFQTIEAAGHHTCGLTIDGKIYCWGQNSGGQLGIGYISEYEPTPQLVTGGHTFQSVSTGGSHTCGITTDGDAYCWGNNTRSQLGDGTPTGGPFPPIWEPSPVAVIGGHKFQTLGLGFKHTCGVTTVGDAYCWGDNWYSQLGIPTDYPHTEAAPQLVTGGHTYRSVSGGEYHSCGVTTAKDAFCWGSNRHGQVGDGTYTTRRSPEFALDLDPPTP